MRNMIRRGLGLLTGLCCLLGLQGQPSELLFTRYSVSDGLCSNTITAITQDEQGFMWFGTKAGLNRFDGYTFRSYQSGTDSADFRDNYIRTIFHGEKENFLIGTENGIFDFDLKTERFSPFHPEITGLISDLERDADGRLWVGTDHGLFSIDTAHSLTGPLFPEVGVCALLTGPEGKLWVATYGQGIMVLDPHTGDSQVYQQSGEPGSLPNDFVLTLHMSMEGVIWAGTLTGGLCYWDAATDRFHSFQHQPGAPSISSNIVRDIYQRRPGELILATEKGLNFMDLSEESFRVYTSRIDDPASLSDNAVWTVYADKAGNIWCGTFFGGINYANINLNTFRHYYPTTAPYSLKGKAVSAFLEQGEGIWVATEDAGLFFFEKSNGHFYHYPFEAGQEPLSYDNLHALYQDQAGRLWIGTYTAGLDIYDPETGQVTNYRHDPDDPSSLSSNSIYTIFEDREGIIWIGSVEGFDRYLPEQGGFERIDTLGLDESVVYAPLEDRDGNLWVPTYDNGLFRRNRSTQQWENISLGSAIEKVVSLCEDRNGRLWIGTDGAGLFCYTDGKVTHVNENGRFPLRSIYYILEDPAGMLWLSSNQGILGYRPETEEIIHFKDWDYLQSHQFNYGAGMIDQQGKVYFGGVNGFNVFHPDSLLASYYYRNHSIQLTDFQLFNRPVPINEQGDVLDQVINQCESLTLSHDQTVISFEYAAIGYGLTRSLSYAYKMEGFDENWNEVGQQRRATYTNLGPGDYVFKVKTLREDKTDTGEERSIQLTILPPFYRTTWAYATYCMLAMLAFWGLRRSALRRAARKNQLKLEEMKHNEEKAFYRRKMEYFTELAHEIRTPLSLIMAPLEKILGQTSPDQPHRKDLAIMKDNTDQLHSLMDQLLDFRKIEHDHYHINPEQQDLIELVRDIHSRFRGLAKQKDIQFEFHASVERLTVLVDVEAIFKILNNLLINAFKFARNCVMLRVRLEPGEEQSYFVIEIEDDGIGIPEEKLQDIFQKFIRVTSGNLEYTNLGGTGIGLFLAKLLTEEHGGTLRVESQEGSFTRFSVHIPHTSSKEDMLTPSVAGSPEADFASGYGGTLLIVEDRPRLLNFLVTSFQEKQFRVLAARNGKEAVEILKTTSIDLVLSDVKMPEMDGLELCHYIKSSLDTSHVPVVLLTAQTDPDLEIEALKMGVDGFLEKPFRLHHLELTLRSLLENRRHLKLKFSSQPLSRADKVAGNTKDEALLQSVIAIIEEHVSDPDLSVVQLSQEVGISRSGLHKKLKEITGLGPNQFIKLIRLKHAARLLKERQLNISEVGYLCGFNTPSYFSRCFHQQFKMTPKEFLEQEAAKEAAANSSE